MGRAVIDAAGAGPATFAVVPPDIQGADFSFIVIGDTGEGDASQHVLRDQLLNVAARNDVRFIVISSDVVYPNGARDSTTLRELVEAGLRHVLKARPGAGWSLSCCETLASMNAD